MRSDVFADEYFGRLQVNNNPSSLLQASTWQPSYSVSLPSRSCKAAKAGGARRDRTDDLMLAKHALSQLSYGPVPEDECFLSRSPSLALRRSSLRSRGPAEPKLQSSEGWWAWEDLNFRPHAYQARALTS